MSKNKQRGPQAAATTTKAVVKPSTPSAQAPSASLPKAVLTLEQHRVKLAYEATESFLGAGAETEKKQRKKDWKTAVLGFGVNVQRCGLLQALGFLQRDANQKVPQHLLPRLRKHLLDRGMLDGKELGDLLTVSRERDATRYMLLTREVLAASVWLKRAAQALCEDEEGKK